jgi:hypothetical protein
MAYEVRLPIDKGGADMYRKPKLVFVFAIAILLTIAFSQGFETKTLKAKVTYAGEGEVDSTKQIHVYLFDTPNIDSGAMPIAWNSSSENGKSVSFSGLTAETLYLVAAYGDYDPTMGPPPSGTPVSYYVPGNPYPTPIEMNESEVEIEFEFDDSATMP